MSIVARLLELLDKDPDGELRLAEQEPIVLRRGQERTAVTKDPLSPESWRGVAAQLAPVLALPGAEPTPTRTVRWSNGAASYLVTLGREQDGPAWATVSRTLNGQTTGASRSSSPTQADVSAARHAVVSDSRGRELIERLLLQQAQGGGSDLHLRSAKPPLVRESGEMRTLDEYPALSSEEVDAMLRSIMPDRNRHEFETTNDTDFAYELPMGAARFRINAFRDQNGSGLVARAIPSRLVTADELQIPAEVRALCRLPKGLVLVTGPTGSGKSTTLCALVDVVNATRKDHVITVEDPIEFVHQSKSCLITQRQVGVHTSSFRQALRAALREDPDVVLVGELRDLETMAMAIETAETGHLVFGTLHTSTAASTVDRIIDQFPTDRQEQIRVMLSESLKGVISQVLCRKIGGGRVAAMEVLLATPAVSNLIREGKTFQLTSIMQTSRKLGMVTMTDALLALVEGGVVEPQEAYAKTSDRSGLVSALKARGIDVSFSETESAAPGARPEASPTARPVSALRTGAVAKR
jgi:twitching motility protein PilT